MLRLAAGVLCLGWIAALPLPGAEPAAAAERTLPTGVKVPAATYALSLQAG